MVRTADHPTPVPAPSAPAARPVGVRRGVALALVALLAVPFTVLGLLQARADGPTWDEPIYLAAGLTTLTEREIRINFEHPPLAKVLSSAPALLIDPPIPADEAWESGDQWFATADFLQANQEAGTLDDVVFLGRLVPLALAVGMGFALYALAAALATRSAGVLAAALWFTSPFFLGLSHFMTIDVPFGLTTVLTALALRRAVSRDRWGDVLAVGLACGAALLVRHTGVLLTGAAGLAVLLGGLRHGVVRALLRAALVGLVAWACVWAGYRGLAPGSGPLPEQADLRVIVLGVADEPPRSAALVTALPWPEEFDLGVGYLGRVSTAPSPAFVMGRQSEGRSLLYWPASMLIKLTPGVLLVLAAGLALLVRRPPEARRTVLLAVLLPATVLAVFTLLQPRPIGLRYLLASIVLVLAASAGVVEHLRGRGGRLALGLLAVTQVAALATAHPHSLAWTTPPFRPAYQYVSDANLDWSQDFPRVAEWARGRNPWIAFVGPLGYGVEDIPGARFLLNVDPRHVNGDIAVFAGSLTQYQRDELSWLRGYCPTGTIGGSVLTYHIDGAPDLRPGPDKPAAPCPGEVSHRVDRVRNRPPASSSAHDRQASA